MKILHVISSDLDKRISETFSKKNDWEIMYLGSWELSEISVRTILKSNYDLILIHLSQPYALALRIAEIIQIKKLPVKLVLTTETQVQIDMLLILFNGIIHLEKNHESEYLKIVEKTLLIENSFLDSHTLNTIIVKIFNKSSSIRYSYIQTFKTLHKEEFTIEDYYLLVGASMRAHSDLLGFSAIHRLQQLCYEIGTNNIPKVLNELNTLGGLVADEDLYKQYLLISNRYHEINHSNLNNTISSDIYDLQRNKIVESLIDLVLKVISKASQDPGRW